MFRNIKVAPATDYLNVAQQSRQDSEQSGSDRVLIGIPQTNEIHESQEDADFPVE